MRDSAERRLRHAREYAETSIRFVGGRSQEAYLNDEGLRLIIERTIEVIGEALNAARRLDPTLEQKIPDLRVAVGVRNRIVHGYDEIDLVILYETVTVSLPKLIEQIDRVVDIGL